MRPKPEQYRVTKPNAGECLLRPPDSVAKLESLRFEQDKLAWEVSSHSK
jgi:hypothetical protein